ncbi:unnamed protein product [Penicillium pancosmium]
MSPPTLSEEYAELMAGNEGRYLFIPQPYSQLHPGVVGYFDHNGLWHTITDICVKGDPESESLSSFERDLELKPTQSTQWNFRTSGKDAENSFGLSAGLSGALSSAPVDVSAEAKNKSSSSGKAALITEQLVKTDQFTKAFNSPIHKWVKNNANAFVNGDHEYDIKKYGLWAIHTTWSTPECAITMQSAHGRDTRVGAEIGATGIAKMGASGSSLSNLQAKNWSTYQAPDVSAENNVFTVFVESNDKVQGEEKGLVVSVGGSYFKLSKRVFSSKHELKEKFVASLPIKSSDGKAPKGEAEGNDEEEFDFDCEATIGLSEAEQKEEEEIEQQEEEKRRQALLQLKEILMDSNLDSAQKEAEVKKVVEENRDVLGDKFSFV